MKVFDDRLRVHVDQDENDQQREGNHDFELLQRGLEILKLSGPFACNSRAGTCTVSFNLSDARRT